MKIKLTHLIIASLISLSVVFSITGISYAGRFVTKKSTYVTTSASGFNKGPEVYDPQKGKPQLLLDLELSVERADYKSVWVTVFNKSGKVMNGRFWINFHLVNPDNTAEAIGWSQDFNVPGPFQLMTTKIAFEPIQTYDGKGWRFDAHANYFENVHQLDEADYSNNYDIACRYNEDCP